MSRFRAGGSADSPPCDADDFPASSSALVRRALGLCRELAEGRTKSRLLALAAAYGNALETEAWDPERADLLADDLIDLLDEAAAERQPPPP